MKVTIDNITVEVPEGTTILEAARKIGGEVVPPTMCYYSKLKGSGVNACLVKVSQMSSAPRPMPKLVASCSTPVNEGMVVRNITSRKFSRPVKPSWNSS
ncbi:MAG: 2Fe-2S iron-sulfur cluster-binding protein [Bacteroidales bacterium]